MPDFSGYRGCPCFLWLRPRLLAPSISLPCCLSASLPLWLVPWSARLQLSRKGKELADDPEFKARVAAGQIRRDYTKAEKKERPATKEAKISVAIFLIAMAGIVLLGRCEASDYTLADGNKLPLTTVIEIFMLVAAAAMVLITKLDSDKVLDQPVFRTGMFAVVLAFGLCWLVNTFMGDQSSFITDNMSALTNEYPWIYIIAVFIVGAITTSQSSTTMIMVPIGIALGLPANIIVAGWIACSSNYFIIAIGNFLMLSPSFPPLHTVHETFASYGVPSYPNRFISYFPVIVWYP